jgi:glycosyltransferase involved in cell wall biosynthesis
MMTLTKTPFTLTVVVPAYNEEQALPLFHNQLNAVLNSLPINKEILYIDDGSTDHTWEVLQQLKNQDASVSLLQLSRNFGKEIALTAGLDHAKGDAIIVIDADLQDPPELIPQLLEKWQQGYDIVYAKRIGREGESLLKKVTAYTFYRIMKRATKVKIPEDTGDFRLLSRRAAEALKTLREQHRFMKGLFAWIGFPQAFILYHRQSRVAGKTKWNYWQLWNFAIEGITSFTIAPLKYATYIGILTSFLSFIYATVVMTKTLLFGNPTPGYSSLMVAILFLSGVQLMTLGIIGEYLGRMFNEVKNRPLYLIQNYSPK